MAINYVNMGPEEFTKIVDEYGYLSALSCLAATAEDTIEVDDDTREYLLIEARRLVTALENIPSMYGK